MKHVVINATNFKATCLALLDEIDQHGGTVTITKRGRPVATMGKASNKAWKSSKGILAGKMKIVGDIVNFNTAELWDALHDTSSEARSHK